MLILFRSKVAFVGLFFSVLQKYFQLSLLLMRSLTILGTAKLRLLCLLSIGLKNWGIFAHVTRLDQSRASENIWWIIRTDSLCPASQWKCWKSGIRSSVFDYDKYILWVNSFGYCQFIFPWKSSGQRAEKELTLETSNLLYGGNLLLLNCFDAKFSSNTSNSGMLAN